MFGVQQHNQGKERGQSLVETAIFLPILVLLLAGLVEVSNLLVTQNRVTTAARVATGFGAANFRGEEWNDPNTWAVPMAQVARNNVTDTLDLDESLWDIWTVKATLNPESTAFTQWNPQHAYGTGAVVSDAAWAAREAQIQADVLEALDPAQVGLEVVATVAFHHRHALLGLNVFDIGFLNRIRGLSVMRVDHPLPYAGCPLLPIAVSVYNGSVYPVGEAENETQEEYPFAPGTQYGNNQNYYWVNKQPGQPPPTMEELLYDFETAVTPPDSYGEEEWGTSILNAQPGYLYLTKQAGESDNPGFGWLRWVKDTSGGSNSSTILGDNLADPYLSLNYYYPPFSEDEDPYQSGIDRFDLVGVSTGAVSSQKDIMRDLVDASADGQKQMLIVFTPSDMDGGDAGGPDGEGHPDGYGTHGTGSDLEYEIFGFVEVRILAWYLPGNFNWMLMKFEGFKKECD